MGQAIFNRKLTDFGGAYTARQLAILAEEIPIENIRVAELGAIMHKATERADAMSYEIASGMKYYKQHPNEYVPIYSIGEAKSILQGLTPWEINWDSDTK